MLKGIFVSDEIKLKLIKPKSELGEAQLCQSRLSLGEILSARLWRAQLYQAQFWSRHSKSYRNIFDRRHATFKDWYRKFLGRYSFCKFFWISGKKKRFSKIE